MSRTEASYRIIDDLDEPSGFRYVVRPAWPFFALLLGGILPGVLWFLANSLAIGSATKRKELAIAVAGVLGFLLLVTLLLTFGATAPAGLMPYLILIPVAWKLMVGYLLFLRQLSGQELYEYYGGQARNGLLPMIGVLVIGSIIGVALRTVSPLLGSLFL